MAADTGDSNADEHWEGFSDYESVSKRLARKVSDAIRAYSILQSAMAEGGHWTDREFAEARSKILEAAMSLMVEVAQEAEKGQEPFNDIYERWTDEGDEEGYISKFHELRLQDNGMPGWVYTFIVDIRTAAWELGYLQAGRTVKEEDLEPADKQAQDMFS